MLSKLYARKNREDGFTLIELLIVVIIIGILAAIALPIFIDQSKIAVDASVQSDVRNSVTNITNAQAQSLGSTGAIEARAALSSSKTHIVLRSASTTSDEATRDGSQFFTDVPALGAAYDLCGFNADGKKFTGVDDKAFGFDAATGKFSEVSNCATDIPYGGSRTPVGGGNPGNPSGGGDDPTTGDPTTEVLVNYLTTPNNYFYGGAISSRGGQTAFFGSTANGVTRYNEYTTLDTGVANAKIVSTGTPAINGLTAGNTYTGAATNVKVLDKNGTPIPTNFASCTFTAAVVDGGSDSNDSYGAKLACLWNGNDKAVDGTYDSDGYGTIVETEDGSVTFDDAQGRANTIKLGNIFYYVQDN